MGCAYYSGGGDDGKTTLLAGQRVSKSDARVNAYGEVALLNAAIGHAIALSRDKMTMRILREVQSDLFAMGAQLSATGGRPAKQIAERLKEIRITRAHVKRIEKNIDLIAAKLRPQKSFILPGGTPGGSWLHYACALARTAERAIVALNAIYAIDRDVLAYANRLSSLLFVLARRENGKVAEDAPEYFTN